MTPRNALTLATTLLLASSAGAESFSGSVGFGTTTDFQGELHFTALDPGETTSSQTAFAGYSQTASTTDYTYLYLLENDSTSGDPTDFCNEHCFISFEVETLFDPTKPGKVNAVGFDDSNGGEAPGDPLSPPGYGTFSSPDLVFWDFDLAPPNGNHGIVPGGGSAFLRFYSPFAPTDIGSAYVTNNTGTASDFLYIATGVTIPVPEPASAALLSLGLAAFAARRRWARP